MMANAACVAATMDRAAMHLPLGNHAASRPTEMAVRIDIASTLCVEAGFSIQTATRGTTNARVSSQSGGHLDSADVRLEAAIVNTMATTNRSKEATPT
jgi:hypothetical protein